MPDSLPIWDLTDLYTDSGTSIQRTWILLQTESLSSMKGAQPDDRC